MGWNWQNWDWLTWAELCQRLGSTSASFAAIQPWTGQLGRRFGFVQLELQLWLSDLVPVDAGHFVGGETARL